MGIPIRVLDESSDPHYRQEGPVEYIVASNGAFISLKNDWHESIVPVFEKVTENSEIAGLREQKSQARWKLPPIPANLMYQIIKFFKEVADKHDTEVAVLLHYGDGGWGVSVPKQEVTGGHVDYKVGPEDRLPGKRMIGTMHSHVDMGAWHSGVDDEDEAQFDGLHVTLGKMSHVPQMVDIDASLVIRGTKFTISHEKWTMGLNKAPEGTTPRKNKWGFTSWSSNPSHSLTSRQLYRETRVPASWHKQVTAKKWHSVFDYSSSYGGSEHGLSRYYGGNDDKDKDEKGDVVPFHRRRDSDIDPLY